MAGEAALLLLKFQISTRVADRGFDLQSIAHDARIPHQPRYLALAEACDALRIEARERRAIALTLVEDRRPRQPRLSALQNQELELSLIVPDRDAPFGVVILM